MSAYYNENDPFAAAWLRELIRRDLIAPGEIDERSIEDVEPDELTGFNQCHFFAGIGGWPYALRLAGWDDERPVWTGSCPCQPFSEAGKQQAQNDARHLWPSWFRLISQCKPSIIFGEQVADAIAFGWLDDAASDMEDEAYAFASAVLPSCSVGSPHKRDRLFFVADASGSDTGGWPTNRRRIEVTQDLGAPWAYANWQGGKSGYDVLDDGISNSMAKRLANGFGNAIVPQLAAEFVNALMECRP